ncbi:hypothetical protein D3C81_1858050 [compost metagenome]
MVRGCGTGREVSDAGNLRRNGPWPIQRSLFSIGMPLHGAGGYRAPDGAGRLCGGIYPGPWCTGGAHAGDRIDPAGRERGGQAGQEFAD